ncbi:Predicted transcriptional regulator [Algoriphagus faecimaris]|uniref:Predicted transcriptional regulator n=1 Tax=Algoriphagus faecimaris TaxID=686796 RepID=A0A1G6RCW9_9BACT|nr:BlaI/MecI/CopY family transcriptional regulator [Algoriphagus faecimaris]SDD01905.1 Predicted transcriptional regulator [Algoriphagus faecimaris]
MLSKSEEELMNYLWKLKRAFMKDLLDLYPEPKPAPTTVSTLLKRMQEKNFVGYKAVKNMREYFPLVSKEQYFSKQLKGMIKTFFDDSPAQFASFFTQKTEMSASELKQLKALIDDQLNKK